MHAGVDADGKVTRIDAIVVSTQHAEEISTRDLRAAIRESVVDPVVPKKLIDRKTKFHINPTGKFVIGGPDGVSDACRERADFTWSLSELTLPHGLARVLFAEQMYRAWSFQTGHPYHRE